MANLENIIFQELETDDIKDAMLVEGALSLTPMLAFYTLKRNTMKTLRKVEKETVGEAKKRARKLKGKALTAREKIRASQGSAGGSKGENTVYKLTKEQIEVLSKVFEKHGPEIIKDIMKFRKEVLAPYQVIKRTVKNNKMLTSQDTFGMTKEQFISSLESGRRKIESRNDRDSNFEDFQERIDKQDRIIQDLETTRDGIREKKEIPPRILARILKEYGVGRKEFEQFSLSDLSKAYNNIKNAGEELGELGGDDDNSLEKAAAINQKVKEIVDYRKGRVAKSDAKKRYEKNKAIRQGKELNADDDGEVNESLILEYKIDLTKNKNFSLAGGGFNSALGLYFLRKSIIAELKPERPDSVYRETYFKIIDELIKSTKEKKIELSTKQVKSKASIEFNEKERKIWELKPGIKYQSGKIGDYIQKLKEEDFFNPEYIHKSPALLKAEKSIEAGIKRFERSLKRKIGDEDFKELKKYRLINDLIVVSDLKSPDKLFKSPDEIRKMSIEKKADAFLSDENFERRIKEILRAEYDSIRELNSARRKAVELFEIKRSQDDGDIADKFEEVLTKIKKRKELKPNKVDKGDVNVADADKKIDIDDIEKLLVTLNKKDYGNEDNNYNTDNDRLRLMIDKFKSQNEKADEELEDLSFLLNNFKTKALS